MAPSSMYVCVQMHTIHRCQEEHTECFVSRFYATMLLASQLYYSKCNKETSTPNPCLLQLFTMHELSFVDTILSSAVKLAIVVRRTMQYSPNSYTLNALRNTPIFVPILGGFIFTMTNFVLQRCGKGWKSKTNKQLETPLSGIGWWKKHTPITLKRTTEVGRRILISITIKNHIL